MTVLAPHQLQNQSSGSVEWYTQPAITSLGRRVMGGINLDPASCTFANMLVGADRYFDRADDGLSRPWVADTVWHNPPFGRTENPCGPNCKKVACSKDGKRGRCITERIPGINEWIDKAVYEYETGNAKQVLTITYAATSETWAVPLFRFPICFLHPRTSYLRLADPATVKPGAGILCLENGVMFEEVDEVTKGSMVTYMGPHVDRFAELFNPLGHVMIPAF